MSTSPISLFSGPAQTQWQIRRQQIQEDFKQLANALQSGDLGGAQKAYAALQQLLPKRTQDGQQSASTSNPISRDFNALGEALQSGDPSTAQSAFSQLQNDLKSQSQSGMANRLAQGVRGHHHHHHASSAQDSDSSSTSGSSSSSTITTGGSGSSGSNGQTVNILA